MHRTVAALSLEEKGFVLATMLGRRAIGAATNVSRGASVVRCRAAIEALTAAPKGDRASALAALIALIRTPVPAGIERLHPDWLWERFEPEASDVIRIVTVALPSEVREVAAAVLRRRGEDGHAPGPPIAPAGVAELQRIVFAGFVPLTGPGAPKGPRTQALLALSPRALVEAIEKRGAEALGTSLRGAPGPIVARAAAALGDRLGGPAVRAATRVGTPDARAQARQVVASTGVQAPGDLGWELGLRALGGELASELADDGLAAVVAVAQRLPPARGRRWLDVAGAGAVL